MRLASTRGLDATSARGLVLIEGGEIGDDGIRNANMTATASWATVSAAPSGLEPFTTSADSGRPTQPTAAEYVRMCVDKVWPGVG